MWFDSWSDLVRVGGSAVAAYAILLLFLRISGARTLSALNAFDLVITVALGSTLATTILSTDVSISEGTLALGVLVALQFSITWTSVRIQKLQKLFKAEPVLLIRDGKILEGAARRARVTQSDLYQAIRSEGFDDPREVAALIMETNGQFSVLGEVEGRDRVLDHVRND